MRRLPLRKVLLGAAAAAALAQGGCGVETKRCEAVAGTYQALYTPLGGNCGPMMNPHDVPFEGGPSGVKTTITRLANANVVTEIVMKGCTARMTQTVEEGGSVTSRIDGTSINIEDENVLTGTIQLMRFDATGQPACQGVYDAVFTKPETGGALIGAAAR